MAAMKLKVIGVGTYGTVHRALFSPFNSLKDSMEIAVKSSELNSENSRTFRRESVFLKSLRGCPHVVQCFGDDISLEEDGKFMYNLLMEYAPGGTLADLITSRGGMISELATSYYAYQLVKGIREVHRTKMVHCDLKPDNVLLFPCPCGCGHNNYLKIADFGLSKYEIERVKSLGVVGTLRYTPPETLLSGMYSAPKDIWAIGGIVLEMITGIPVWESSKEDTKSMIRSSKPEIPIEVSDSARDFLEKCFERDPKYRWTAEMLITHPFIVRHHDYKTTFDHPDIIMGTTWTSYKGLFCNSFYSNPMPPLPSCCPVNPLLSQNFRSQEKTERDLSNY